MEALERVTESSHSASMDQRRSNLHNLWINLIEEWWRGPGNDSAYSGKQRERGDKNAFALLSLPSPSPERFAFICWQKLASTISHGIAFLEVLLCSYLRDFCWFVFVLSYPHSFWKFPRTGSYSPAEVINLSHTKHSGDFEGIYFLCSCVLVLIFPQSCGWEYHSVVFAVGKSEIQGQGHDFVI